MTSSRFDAALFDLDGTLVDSFEAIRASVNHVRGRNGLEPLPLADVTRAVGNGLARLMELVCPVGDPAANAAAYLAHHPDAIGPGTTVLPEVRETLLELRARGLKLAICSNKPLPMTERLLHETGLASLFSAVLGPESVPRRKPDPDMLLEACRRLGTEPDRSLYVGDMTIDIAAARAGGLFVAVIPGGHSADQLRGAGPDRLLTRFSELLETL